MPTLFLRLLRLQINVGGKLLLLVDHQQIPQPSRLANELSWVAIPH